MPAPIPTLSPNTAPGSFDATAPLSRAERRAAARTKGGAKPSGGRVSGRPEPRGGGRNTGRVAGPNRQFATRRSG